MAARDGEGILAPLLAQNPGLRQYVEPFTIGRESPRIVKHKRDGIHERMRALLAQLTEDLKAKREAIALRLNETTKQSVIRRPVSYFHCAERNLIVRRLTWTEATVIRKKLKVLMIRLERIVAHSLNTELLSVFFTNQVDLLPPSSGVRIKESFFTHKPDAPPRLLARAVGLREYGRRLAAEVAAFDPPLSIGNFKLYFDGLLNIAVDRLDKSISYSRPLPGEVEISRYIFSNPANVKCAEEIDRVIDIALSGDTADFVRRAIELSLRLIPECELRSAQEQSVGLMMFFRVIFDRFYHKSVPNVRTFNPEAQSVLMKLSHLPLTFFRLPMTVDDPAILQCPIRDFFLNDQFFRTAVLFLNETMYICNPVDSLFFVHRSLLQIHKAALLLSSKSGELTLSDLRTVLPFDDLFAYLVGVVLASDIPNFFAMADFIETYTPQKCLSNSFEYAQAAVGALVLHFQGSHVEAMQRQLDAPPGETPVGELLAEELAALDSPSDDCLATLDSPPDEGLANSPLAATDALVATSDAPVPAIDGLTADEALRAEESA